MDTFVWMISVCLNYCIACVCENKMASELPHEAQQVHQAPLGQGGRKRERDRKIERECVTERQETDRERDVRKEGKSEGRKNGDWEWGGGRLPTFLVFCQANERCETKKKQKKTAKQNRGGGKQQKLLDFFSTLISPLFAKLSCEYDTRMERQTKNGTPAAYGQQRPSQNKSKQTTSRLPVIGQEFSWRRDLPFKGLGTTQR